MFLKTCTRFYYHYKDLMYAYNSACYFHPYSYGDIINQVNHFKYNTCEIIEKNEWDMIRKCLFVAELLFVNL